MLWVNVKLALQAMVHNKMRTLLSLIGIFIGVGAVVAVMTLGQSVTNSMNASLQAGGLNMITIFPNGRARELDVFNEDLGTAMMKDVAGMDAVLPVASTSAVLRNGQDLYTATVQGVYSGYFELNSLSLFEGSFFSAEDNITRRQVVVLGEDLAEELFPVGSAVGQTVSIFRTQAKSYEVIGVLDTRDDTLGNSYNYSAFIPYNTYNQKLRKITMPSMYTVRVVDGYNAVSVAEDVEDYLYMMVGDDSYYTVYSPATLVEMSDSIMGSMTMFLACIAGISLLVGGIGIMNIMLVSVVERTKEIGIRKALGATPRTIQGQFLIESITLTVIGGLLGIAVGIGVSYVVAVFAGWELSISYTAVVVALGFSMLIGVFFGWYPAKKASALDPIQALSYE